MTMNMIEKQGIRQRTFGWSDPKALVEAGRKMPGLAFLEALKNGDLPPPPVTQLVDFTLAEVEDGRVVAAMQPQEFHFNPIGTVHGGIIATLLDSVMGLAVHSTLDAGRGYTTLEIKVNYLRAVTIKTGPVQAIGRIVHRGRQTAMAEASLIDAAGKLLAQSNTTCLLFDMPAGKAE
jgi:uncharacterized protein (TIGR00369 family)